MGSATQCLAKPETKKKLARESQLFEVPTEGLEPPRPCDRVDLNHVRLPIPSCRLGTYTTETNRITRGRPKSRTGPDWRAGSTSARREDASRTNAFVGQSPAVRRGAQRGREKLLAVRAQVVRNAVMRGFLIGLSVSLAFIAGCVASSTRYGVPKAEAAAVVEQRWSYFCFEASNVDDLSFKANAAGLRGWDLVTSTTKTEGGIVACFRQPRP